MTAQEEMERLRQQWAQARRQEHAALREEMARHRRAIRSYTLARQPSSQPWATRLGLLMLMTLLMLGAVYHLLG